MQQRNPGCPSDLRLDQWLAGELTRAEQSELEPHVAACAACSSRRAGLVESHRSFAESAPPFAEQWLPEAAARRERIEPRRRFAWRRAVPALAAAAALGLAIGQPWQRWRPEADGLGTRTKGSLAKLGWVLRRGERVFAGRPDLPLRAGDALRFTVSAREPVYVALLEQDAAGRLSVLYPEAEELARLEPGNDQPLPVAVQLDATPGDERLYGVFCRNPTPLARVKQALERSADAPTLPAGCSLERQTLHEETP